MVKTGYKKVFTDREKLDQMLALRQVGWAESSLSLFFGTSKSSISDRLTKHKVPKPPRVYTIERFTIAIPGGDPRWRIMGGERTNLGRSYRDYLQMSN